MVQVIYMPQKQSTSEDIGSAIGEGFYRGVTESMHERRAQMVKDREEDKRVKAIQNSAERLAALDGVPELASIYASIGVSAGGEAMVKFYNSMTKKSKMNYMQNVGQHANAQKDKYNTRQEEQFQGQENLKGQGKADVGIPRPQTDVPYEDREAQDELTESIAKTSPNALGQAKTPSIVLHSRQGTITQPEAIKQPSRAIAAQEPQQGDGYHDQFVGFDEKTGLEKFMRLPNTIADAKTREDAQKYADWNSSSEKEKNQLMSQWRAFQGLDISERRATASEAKVDIEKEKLNMQKAKEEREKTQDYRKRIAEKRATLEGREESFNLADKAALEGSESGFLEMMKELHPSLDFTKEESQELLKVASKGHLISTAAKFGSRLNMFIEKKMSEMFARPGLPKNTKLAINAANRYTLDVDKKEVEIFDKIVQDYKAHGMEPPENIDAMVYRELYPYARKREDKLALQLQEITERNATLQDLQAIKPAKIKDVTPLTEKRAIALYERYGRNQEAAEIAAKNMGYKDYEIEE